MGVISFVAFYVATQLASCFYVLAGLLAIPLPGSPPEFLAWVLDMRWGCTLTSAKLSRAPRLMICANHRTWADFVVDMAVIGNGVVLSRLAVMIVLPWTGAYSWFFGGAIIIQRGKKHAKRDWLNDIVDDHLTNLTPGQPFLVYPEGHRNTKPGSLPLRTGTLRMAHALQLPVQITITTNKDDAVSEKTLHIARGVTLVTHTSPVLRPDDAEFAGEGGVDKWIARFQAEWDASWKAAEDGRAAGEGKGFASRSRALLPIAAEGDDSDAGVEADAYVRHCRCVRAAVGRPANRRAGDVPAARCWCVRPPVKVSINVAPPTGRAVTSREREKKKK